MALPLLPPPKTANFSSEVPRGAEASFVRQPEGRGEDCRNNGWTDEKMNSLSIPPSKNVNSCVLRSQDRREEADESDGVM